MKSGNRAHYDPYLILTYLALVAIGWLGIYTAAPVAEYASVFDLSELYGRQFIFIGASLAIIIVLLALTPEFYERFAGLIYIISLVSLAGLYIFGKEVNGAQSWYGIGSFTLQPSEFAKAATALAVAKYVSQLEVSLTSVRDLFITGGIIALPAILIIPQPDPGSALVYTAFFFALYREGLSLWYLLVLAAMVLLFVGALAIEMWMLLLIIFLLVLVWYTLSRKRNHKKRLPKPRIFNYVAIMAIAMVFVASVEPIFNNVLQDRHRNRINIALGKTTDIAGTGYNLNQSQIAIGNGGVSGTGLRKGTQTQGEFVPEQETDFIFSAIGEELGFLGTAAVVVLFTFLVVRILLLAEKQKDQFVRVYGYGIAGIFFMHYFVNIGMVMGLLPTVGIPLPFMSYGGSGLMGFTIMLFIFIKLDGHRLSYD
ncbi:MAG: rod shape-determining protein RodA [Nonlabens sp.]